MSSHTTFTRLALSAAMLATLTLPALSQPTADRILGLRSRGTGFLIQIGSGFARDTTDTDFLIVPRGESRFVDVRTTGPGGLDQGTVQPKRSYALWIVSTGGASHVRASLSFEASGVTVPSGALLRRIGSFATDATARLITFRQIGMGNDREVAYNAELNTLNILTNGRETSYTAVKFGYLAPVTLESVKIAVDPQLSPVSVRTQSSPEHIFQTPGTANVLDGAALELEYRNHFGWGRATIAVTGYTETL